MCIFVRVFVLGVQCRNNPQRSPHEYSPVALKCKWLIIIIPAVVLMFYNGMCLFTVVVLFGFREIETQILHGVDDA